MATDNPAKKDTNENQDTAKEKQTPALVPPDERFWQRYSPNHEFPLSSASSAMIHLFVLGFLVLGAKTLAAWDSPVDVDALVVGGRGARPDGEEGPHTGRFAKREDVKGIADNAA